MKLIVLSTWLSLIVAGCSSDTTPNQMFDAGAEAGSPVPSNGAMGSPLTARCDALIPTATIEAIAGKPLVAQLAGARSAETSFECARDYRLVAQARSYLQVIHYEYVTVADAIRQLQELRGRSPFKNDVANLGEEAIYNESLSALENKNYVFRKGKVLIHVAQLVRTDIASEAALITDDKLLELAKALDK